MKIEIGESLCLSYLKHVKKCVLYQSNWKSSSKWEFFNGEEVEAIFETIKKHNTFKKVLKQSTPQQFLKQAEIDALGIDQGRKVYAIDIAYHKSGLNYGSTGETTQRLMKKYLRSYLILLSYFPNRDYEIIFASPKVNKTVEDSILIALKELNETFVNERVEFKYFSNEAFREEILNKSITNSEEDSDTNELFMRAYKLLQISEPSRKIPKISKQIETSTQRENILKQTPEIELIPSDDNTFKNELIRTKQAKRTWFFKDGRVIQDFWKANKFNEDSDLKSNIRSTQQARNPQETGLYKVRLEIIE